MDNQAIDYSDDTYEVERQPMVSGQVKGNVNLFRHMLPGDQTLDVTDYSSLKFNVTNNMPIEIVLMQENLEDWNDRFRYTIPENDNETMYTIYLSDFVDGDGEAANIIDVKTIVFSVIGNYNSYLPFNISVNNLAFSEDAETLSVTTFENEAQIDEIIAIPNPILTQTELSFVSNQNEEIFLVVYDQVGKVVRQQSLIVQLGKNRFKLERNGLNPGLYFCRIISQNQNYKTLKLLFK